MSRFPLFFHGWLRETELMSLVLGRDSESAEIVPAALPGWSAKVAPHGWEPLLFKAPGEEAPGLLLRDAEPQELARLRFDFGGDGREMFVRIEDGEETALVFALQAAAGEAEGFETWRLEDRPEAERAFRRECAREMAALFGSGADPADGALRAGVAARAAARAAAGRASSSAGLLRRRYGGDALARGTETLALRHPYAGFFGVEEHVIRHLRLDGGMTGALTRAAWVSGDAATVLPYDVRRDAVLLITQWRAGPHARGDAAPWPMEAIAGRLHGAEEPADAVRREALEEAGLTLGRLERIGGYYPSPGAVAEYVVSYVGEADLEGAGGVGGLEAEDEDILSVVVSFDEAMEMLKRGEADTSPALISLLWLARHRDRLRRAWG